MSYLMTEEQQMAVDGLRKFLDNEIEPIVKEYYEKFIPVEKMKEIHKQLINYGLSIAPHPEEFGGMGLDWTTHLRLYEEVAYTSSDTFGQWGSTAYQRALSAGSIEW